MADTWAFTFSWAGNLQDLPATPAQIVDYKQLNVGCIRVTLLCTKEQLKEAFGTILDARWGFDFTAQILIRLSDGRIIQPIELAGRV